ncbi:MAG: TetR/AcrR family transcriptional regulator [Anaerolineae bacterium]
MRKQPELTAQTRENLIEAFWRLYCEKPIERVTVKDITESAGYHRSTFYEYFTDIYEVLNQLETSLLDRLKETVLQSLDVAQAGDLTQRLADLFEAEGSYLSVLLGDRGDPNFARRIKTTMQPALTGAFGLVGDDAHTPYIYEFALSAIIATLTYWYQSGQNVASNELVSMIREMLRHGALSIARLE